MALSMLNITKYHVIPILYLIGATVGGVTAQATLASVETESPHKRILTVPGVRAEKRGKDESNVTIYGIDYPNTLYTAHSLYTHTLLSQPKELYKAL